MSVEQYRHLASMHKLNVGCGPYYADGWVNVDLVNDDIIKPDVVVTNHDPYPFADNYFDVLYVGHVLEHMPWDKVELFLNELSRIAKPDAIFMIVGPDVYKVFDMWKNEELPIEMVKATVEHQDLNYQKDRDENMLWDGAPHYWNCHEDRIIRLLSKMGFKDIRNEYEDLIVTESKCRQLEWPLVSGVKWQLAVSCINKD